MGMVGADIDDLEWLSSLMDAKARQLETIHRMLGRQLHSSPWRGPSADRFRSRWVTEHGKLVGESVSFLRHAAAVLHANAVEQRNASVATTGAGVGTGSAASRNAAELAQRYEATRRQIEARKTDLKREMARLRHLPDRGGLLEALGDANPFARSKQETHEDEIRALQSELKVFEGMQHLDTRQLWMIKSTPGDNRIIEVYGDLSTATKVIVHVPGMNTDLGDYADGHSNAKNLYDQAQAMYGRRVAVVSFANYNVPDDPGEAASARAAESGVPALESMVGRLHAMGYGTNDISIVAHSYGSTLTGHAMRHGLDVGRVIVLGSPGMGADDRADLGSPKVDLWAASAPLSSEQWETSAGGAVAGGVAGFLLLGPVGAVGGAAAGGVIGAGDPVSWAPAHGESPAAVGFGAHRFDVPDAHGHSCYFDPDSASLKNVTRLAIGREPR